MTNFEKARCNALKPIIRFHWEKSRLKKKSALEGGEKAVYKPSLIRGKTLNLDAVIAEYAAQGGLPQHITASDLKLWVRDIIKSMVQNTLIDGRSRCFDDFFTVRLDMKGTAERHDEP